jgi:hypothetical protein
MSNGVEDIHGREEFDDVVAGEIQEQSNNGNEKSDISAGIVPSELEEVLDEMPPDVRKKFNSAIFGMFSSQSVGPMINPIIEKFNDDHIDKYLDYMQRDDENEHQLKRTNRWFYLITLIIFLGVVVFLLVYLLPRDRELLTTLMQIFLALAGGVGAGFGLSKKK